MLVKRELDDEIIYGARKYHTLVQATVATSTLSMMSSLFIIVAFIYLRFYNPSKANRVSLRCVFMTSIMNLINSIFDITSILQSGDTVFCRSSSIVTMFTRVMSATFLALVSINLVLVFVLNVKSSACHLEWIYYPGALVYGLITISVPIAEQSKGPLNPDSIYRCYYFVNHYQLMGHNSLLWMWFYGFLFLTVVIAMLCSVIALVKLMHEHHLLIGKFTTIANSSQTQDVSNSHVQHRIKAQSNIFMRVISRCVIYPLVPLICNIWGFVFQLILNSSRASPPVFALSMIDTVFRDLQGFFVAIVFFSDPAMTEFMCTRFNSWKHKYLDEFSQIRKFSDGQIQMLSLSCSSNASTVAASPTERKSSNASSVLLTHVKQPSLATLPLTTRMHSFSSISNGDFFKEKRRFGSHDEFLPMHRMSVSPSIYNRISHNNQHNMNNHGVDIISHPPSIYNGSTATNSERRPSSQMNNNVRFADPEQENQILVPYTHPKLASAIHWTLVHCGFKNKTTNNNNTEEYLMPEHQPNCTIHPLQHN